MLKRYATETRENITGQFNSNVYDKGFLIKKVAKEKQDDYKIEMQHIPADYNSTNESKEYLNSLKLEQNKKETFKKVNININYEKDKERESPLNQNHINNQGQLFAVRSKGNNWTKTTLEYDDNLQGGISPKFSSNQIVDHKNMIKYNKNNTQNNFTYNYQN